MIGTNEMSLNEATMIEIVQYWLNNKLLNPHETHPTVSGVKYSSSEHAFTVKLEEPQKSAT